MPKRKKKRGAKGSSSSSKYLIVQDTDGNVYLVTPERLGPPIDNPQLAKAIDSYVAQRKVRLEGLDFALLICDHEMVMRLVGNNRPN